jgi:hypothetical protein
MGTLEQRPIMLCACQAYEELSQSGACLEQKVQSNRLDGHTYEMRTVFMRDVFIVTEQHLVDADGPLRRPVFIKKSRNTYFIEDSEIASLRSLPQ